MKFRDIFIAIFGKTESSNNFRYEVAEKPGEILEIFGTLLRICQGTL